MSHKSKNVVTKTALPKNELTNKAANFDDEKENNEEKSNQNHVKSSQEMDETTRI